MPSPSVVLRIELLNIEPLIWRRVRVPAKWKLRKVHDLIQRAFGWQDYHLHEFRVGDTRIGMPDADDMSEGLQDDRKWTLSQVVEAGAREFLYTYDFGDGWEHRVVVEAETQKGEAATFSPVCLAGENAAPPEDVGGYPGYQEFLAALADPRNERHTELLEWIGGVWDPKAFDLNALNRELRKPR